MRNMDNNRIEAKTAQDFLRAGLDNWLEGWLSGCFFCNKSITSS